MQFSDSSGKDGIVEEIDFLLQLKNPTTDYPIAQKTRNVNRGLDRMVALVLQADNNWEWDDSNHTDLPIATANLTSGQRDYGFPASYLRVSKILIKDKAGNWQELDPISKHGAYGEKLHKEDLTGTPLRYDVQGRSIFLDPEPDYNSTGGLKVHFQRTVDYFTTADTTQSPGFASPFHRLLSLYASHDYALAHSLWSKMKVFKNEIQILEAGLMEHYASRKRDEQPRLTVKSEDYGAKDSKYDYGSGQPSVDWN